MASVYLSAQSNAPGSSTVVLINGEPSTTGYRLLNVDVGNPAFDKRYSGPRGSLGAVLAGETAQNRLSTFRLQAVGTSQDDLETKLSVLWVLDEQLRRYGGTVVWRPQGSTTRMRITALDSGVSLEALDVNLFVLNNRANVNLGIVSGPYYEGEPMDILDDFSVDTLANYAFDTGSAANLAVAGGVLTVTGSPTTEKRLIHIDRGYSYGDHQVTLAATPGSTISSFKAGVVLKRIDASNYLEVYVDDNATNSRLRIDKVVATVRTNLASTNLAARVSNGTAFWVRGRIEGNTVYAEYFTTAGGAPWPMATPISSTSFTLTGGDITQFGIAASGKAGFSWIPQQSAATLDDFEVLPFVYRNVSTPLMISPGGTVPGDAPALGSFSVTVGTIAQPLRFAMLSWWPRSTVWPGGNPVLGLFQAEDGGYAGWTPTADANYSGGNGLKRTTTGAESMVCSFLVNTGGYTPDDFRDSIDVEVWAHAEVASTLVNPRLTVAAQTTSSSSSYTVEYGTAGKRLNVPSSSTALRFLRLGTISLTMADLVRNVTITGNVDTGSSGIFGLDYIVLVPANRRALSPTGKTVGSVPIFILGSNATKTIQSDLRGSVGVFGVFSPDPGLGGSLIEIPPGKIQMFARMARRVPDDPEDFSTETPTAQAATIQLGITPRWRLGRAPG